MEVGLGGISISVGSFAEVVLSTGKFVRIIYVPRSQLLIKSLLKVLMHVIF